MLNHIQGNNYTIHWIITIEMTLHRHTGLSTIMFLQMVSLFLSKGASVNAKDKKDRQPIHWAAYLGEWRQHVHLHFLPRINVSFVFYEWKE